MESEHEVRSPNAAMAEIKCLLTLQSISFIVHISVFFGTVCSQSKTPPIIYPQREWIVTEDEPVGTVVTRVTFSYPGHDKDQVNVTLDQPSSLPPGWVDASNYFSIDLEGRVRISKPLKGLAGKHLLVGILASDGQLRSRVDARVIVRDVNSKGLFQPSHGLGGNFDLVPPPPLPKRPLSEVPSPPFLHMDPDTVWEISSTATLGAYVATVEADDITNTFLRFSIKSNNMLQIDPETGKVTVASPLLAKEGKHAIRITATNQYSSISEEVLLYVTGLNGTSTADVSSVSNHLPEEDKAQVKTGISLQENNSPYDFPGLRNNEDEYSENFIAVARPSRKNGPIHGKVTKETNSTTEGDVESKEEVTFGLTVVSLVLFLGIIPLISISAFMLWKWKRKHSSATVKNSVIFYTEKQTGEGRELEASHRNGFLEGVLAKLKKAESNSYEEDNRMNRPKVPSRAISRITSNDQADEWEFSRHKLRFLGILGEGCFGQVWKCEAAGLRKECPCLVAVKTLKESAGGQERKDLLQELQVLKNLRNHPNVVSLLGCCTDKDPVFVILEYMAGGKLQTYLRESRSRHPYDNLHSTSSTLSPRDLTIFALQVARGMEFLSKNGIIHRDLAARNVLLGQDKVCKVADFGFARDVANNHVYERKSDGRLPIRWMAVESLFDNIFTTKSDVWSFGILLWEIVTLGSTPYPGMSASDVMRQVKEGYRLDKPAHCKRELFNIMYYCWDVSPEERPTFTELVANLESLIMKEVDYVQLDNFPDHAYYNFITGSQSGELL